MTFSSNIRGCIGDLCVRLLEQQVHGEALTHYRVGGSLQDRQVNRVDFQMPLSVITGMHLQIHRQIEQDIGRLV